MNTLIKYCYITIIVGAIAMISSCSDFMSLTPTTQYNEPDVWSDAGLVQGLINDAYAYVMHGSEESNTSGMTDDAYFTHNYGMKAINETAVSESDLQWFNDASCPFRWSDRYLGIYRTNLVLANIDKVPVNPRYNLDIIKGEAHFLRAYLYAELVRGFGGVPLVDKAYTSVEEAAEIRIPRSNVAECLDFILKDIDAALGLLPETVTGANLGRATKGAAKALKARLSLHLASPLYADRTINTLDVNQYTGDRNALYEQALATAVEVINNGLYSLIDCNGISTAEIADKFHQIIISNNDETIFAKQFMTKPTGDRNISNRASICHGPNGYHNWAGVTPTQDLVMAFEMEDGSLTDALTELGQSSTTNPYINREPRFYATIGYDGAEWGRPRPTDSYTHDPTPLGNLQMGNYEVNDGAGLDLTLPNGTSLKFTGLYGVDTRKSPIEDWNGSFTGYLEKKLIDGTVATSESVFQTVPYPYIRLAEMYLIAAEACIELNRLDDAAEYLDALRLRIGRPDTRATLAVRGKSFNQSDLRDFLRQERRAELAYEESRYYDVRRWMIAPQTASKSLKGIMIVARLKPGKTANKPYVKNAELWDYTYYVTDLSYRESRKWDNKMYFAPIKRDEIRRNPSLVQNPGMQ
ncbi:MAG: RagB/SusD family nutrient uptake outer membrane protein [Tannerellaceae bacterium]|jgi:hypothetical protein|nr:RagB/SusD family nutrient uptake outer membrane protein [Tannerellaceae bacterium]